MRIRSERSAGNRRSRARRDHQPPACARLALFVALMSMTLAAPATTDDGSLAAVPEGAAAPAAALREAAALAEAGQVTAAIAALERLAKRHPDDPMVLNDLSALHARRGDLETARQLLERALQADPAYGRVYSNLQVILGTLAAQAYDRALSDTPTAQPPPRLAVFGSGDGGMSVAEETTGREVTLDTLAAAPPARSAAPATRAAAPRPSSARVPASPPVVARGIAAPGTTMGSAMGPGSQLALAAPDREAATADADSVVAMVRAWASAWSKQDVDGYLDFYGHHFVPPAGMTGDAWRAQRRRRVRAPRFIEVTIDDIEVSFSTPERAIARFAQHYRSNVLDSRIRKVLFLSRGDDGAWKIVRERVDH